MKTSLVLTLILVLWDGAGLTRAETVTAAEGQDIRVSCWFIFPGSNKIFCKNDCKNKEDILVETSKSRQYKSRYSIEYEVKRSYIMHVSIKNVTKSDAGRYQCVIERSIKNGYYTFNIVVTTDATSSNHNVILKPTVTSWTSSVSASPQTLPFSSVSSETSTRSDHEQQLQSTTAPPSAASGALLYLGLTLAAIVLLLSVMLCWKNRINKTKDTAVDAENGQTAETDRVYEEIPEEFRQSGAPVVNRAPADQTSGIYSLATAPSDL